MGNKKKTILLVEDEAITAHALAKSLEKERYNVIIAYNGINAIDRMRRSPVIDLILLDIDLGSGMDGIETAETILQEHNVPIVFLTNHTEPEIIEKVEKTTPYNYILKSSRPQLLFASIKMALKLFDAHYQLKLREECLLTMNERMQFANEKIQESQEIFSAFMKHLPAFAHIKDTDGRFIYINNNLEELLTVTGTPWQGKTIEQLVPHGNILNVFENDEKLVLTKSPMILEENLEINGKRLTLISYRFPIFIKNNKLLLGGVSVDVTDLKKVSEELNQKNREIRDSNERLEKIVAELEKSNQELNRSNTAIRETNILLSQSEERFTKAFRSNPAPMVISDIETGRFIDVNDKWLQMVGYTREYMIGRTSKELNLWIDPLDRDCMMRKLKTEKRLREYPINLVTEFGTELYILWYSEIIKINGVEYALSLGADLTDKKKAEDALKKSERKYRLIAENVNDVIYLMNTDFQVIYISPSIKNLRGFTAKETMQQKFIDIITPDSYSMVKRIFNKERILNGDSPATRLNPIEVEVYCKDGSTVITENEFSIMKDEKGELIGFLCVSRNISQRKRAENEILRLNRHILKIQEEERKKISRDLHDGVGQTLIAAMSNIELFQKNPGKYADHITLGIEFIKKANNELREIYNGLFPSILTDLGLPATIRWYSKNFLESYGIKTRLILPQKLPLSQEIEVTLYRIIQELYTNIIKHSGADTVITQLELGDNKVILTVEDNGIGIADICNPEGKGNGLINIRQRVKNLGGDFEIKTKKSTGTIAIISITGFHDEE